ncbi:hypothetical protein CHGG_06358 [Chaetomium globosum CBS 148.51]|uniref:ATP-dependent DNA helicase n=1 Tax=Chaetomium globosum (strain ATCC 6205 / CBS 148.51 / DSM 1962 / NBRC 6347 / NRRL 1970) TaxID=306901 RepID=Q2H4Q7_CHAGB|nr:uncharacterized protein CHGG_06358 [Chaetomium globosum CBS 148.51]EAQ89739.1 hypothetical protein CHGG_06358 [Chaetomium globosum CBS 148.51]
MARTAALILALASFAATVSGLTDTASIDYTDLHPIVAPTAAPDASETDPWRCATEDPMTYLSVPMPTGELREAHDSFGSSLIQTCLTSGTYDYPCAFPDKSRWCGFTTAMPASLLPAYTQYARSASSWWAANSASVIRIAEECPIMWYEASNFGVLGGAVFLNHTLINAECYAEANPTLTLSATEQPTATPGQGATESDPTSTATPQPTQTSSLPNSRRNFQRAHFQSVPLTTPHPSTGSCNGGTHADGESDAYADLCSFACSFGYCPPGPCQCTSYGVPGKPPASNGMDGCPLVPGGGGENVVVGRSQRFQRLGVIESDRRAAMTMGQAAKLCHRLPIQGGAYHIPSQFFGGLSVILIGDFFQLPPVLNKPLYSTRDDLKDIEMVGRNAYLSFDKSVFLTTIQRQQGEDQAPFRRALEELRKADVSVPSWELLASRCSVKLSPEEVDSFADALRIYPTKAQVEAKHEGVGAEKVESSNAGNLAKRLPLCVGCRVMLTRNLWANVGLVNGAQGTVYDISWKEGADVLRDPPEVIMVAFDDYDGPGFTMPNGEPLRSGEKLVVPILRVRQEFMIGANSCSREQFPLLVSYAITVHKSQGITLDKVVCDISASEFASGLSYVAVSPVKTLGGLMFERPFDRSRVYRETPSRAMGLKLLDHATRRLQALDAVAGVDPSEELSGFISSDEESHHRDSKSGGPPDVSK